MTISGLQRFLFSVNVFTLAWPPFNPPKEPDVHVTVVGTGYVDLTFKLIKQRLKQPVIVDGRGEAS